MIAQLKRYGVFAGGSAFGAVVDYIVTLVAVRALGISPETALALAMVFSATAVFFWHEHLTFGSKGQPGLSRRYILFMLWSVVVWGMRAGMLFLFRMAGMPLYAALALAIGIASVVNYILSSRAIFRTTHQR
ncbi:GtrA family protein [Paracoccus litorisediminis]|uniref:GtrA family protein n=1 Tax=Paracoccus litorisediminis TaxID=2006130 RepID=UPI0014797776